MAGPKLKIPDLSYPLWSKMMIIIYLRLPLEKHSDMLLVRWYDFCYAR